MQPGVFFKWVSILIADDTLDGTIGSRRIRFNSLAEQIKKDSIGNKGKQNRDALL
jgi:hypothetical protein